MPSGNPLTTLPLCRSLFMALLMLGIANVLPAQDRREEIRSFPSTTSLVRHHQLGNGDLSQSDIGRDVGRVLSLAPIKEAINELNQSELVVDTSGFYSLESQGSQFFAFFLRHRNGQYLDQSTSRTEISLHSLLVSGSGRSLTVEMVIGKDSGQPHRLVVRDPSNGTGLEFNHQDQKVYSLARPNAVSGTVGCVLQALGDLAKPCEIVFLSGTLGTCVASIALLPESAGLSAILAIPTCSAALGQLIQAVICGLSGVDCGLSSASQGDFSLSANPSSRVITQGQSTTFMITATFTGGFSGPVTNFSVSNLPSGVSASFSSSSIATSGGNTTLNIATTQTSPIIDVPLTVSATGAGGLTRSITVELNINPASPPPGGSGTTLSNGQTVSGTLTKDQKANYTISVPAGASLLNVAMTGSGDADLYVKYGSPPTVSNGSVHTSTECVPWTSSTNESCSFTNPSSGTWYIMVNGYANSNSNYTLTATYTTSSGGTTTPHIDDISPKSVPIGVENLFNITGSGFQAGFQGKLWVGNNPYLVDPSKLTFVNANLVQMAVRVGATVDPTTAFGLQVINPSGSQSNTFTGLTAVHGSSGGATGNLQVTMTPPSVTRGADGKFLFSINLRETNSVAMTLVGMSAGGTDLSQNIVQWFGSNQIAPNGQLNVSVSTTCPSPCNYDYFWGFTANDVNGHNGLTFSATVHLGQ